jgi:hypothetical protein
MKKITRELLNLEKNMKRNVFLLVLLFLEIILFGQNQNDYEFTVIGTGRNQSVTITKYIGNNVNVKVPEYINGIPVTTIGEKAFEQSNIKTIEMSNSIISIGMRAFYGCQELTTVLLSASVTNLGREASVRVGTGGAADQTSSHLIGGVAGQLGIYGLDLIFDGCSKLASINVDPNNPKYCSIDGVLFNKQMTILFFYPHGKEGSYIVPNSVSEIREGAFFNCTRLSSVFLPENLKNIGMFNFFFCPSITSFNVDVNNKIYISEDGVLYSKNKEELLKFPSGKTGFFRVPDFVKIIGHGAFFGCGSETRINISFNNIIKINHGGLAGFNFGNMQEDLNTRFPLAFDLPMDIVFLFDE